MFDDLTDVLSACGALSPAREADDAQGYGSARTRASRMGDVAPDGAGNYCEPAMSEQRGDVPIGRVRTTTKEKV
jgi:hypothetical protein